MTKSFEQLLYLFGAASLGKEVVIEGEINVEEIRKYAIEQGIWTVIFKKLEKICDISEYKNEFFSIVVKSIRKTEHNSFILKELEKNGVECCLLKGNAVSRLYHIPECRVSGDVDILINPADEKKSIQILSENGYKVDKRKTNDHHFKAYHSVGGLLEVHVMLYSKVTEEVIFNGKKFYSEPYQEITINNNRCKTLGINDGLMYLTAHYIKHLINSGGGIRQMMDLLLYIEHYKKDIDFEKYYEILRQLRYEKLIKVVLSIGAKYFGFNYEVVEEDLMLEVLDDTEQGGIFGFSSTDRNGFYNSYCKRRATGSKIKYNIFYMLKGEGTFLRIFFPSKRNMHRLGYDDKILFVAWLKRFYGVLFKKRPSNVEAKKSGIAARMVLMKNLNMIE